MTVASSRGRQLGGVRGRGVWVVVVLCLTFAVTGCGRGSQGHVIPTSYQDAVRLGMGGGSASFGFFPFETWEAPPDDSVRLVDVRTRTRGGVRLRAGLVFLTSEARPMGLGAMRGSAACRYSTFAAATEMPLLPPENEALARTQLVLILDDDDGAGVVEGFELVLDNGQTLSYDHTITLTHSTSFDADDGTCSS